MSTTKRLHRQSLFDLFRGLRGDAPAPPAPAAPFSLAAFYERREAEAEAALGPGAFPPVVRRPGVAAAPTTRVGAGPDVPAEPIRRKGAP
jgi:hypothetical protein